MAEWKSFQTKHVVIDDLDGANARRAHRRELLRLSVIGLLCGLGVFVASMALIYPRVIETMATDAMTKRFVPDDRTQAESSVYYVTCAAARAAGAAPLKRGQPGYRRVLDGDGDGVACEPWWPESLTRFTNWLSGE